ncbi:MAG: hypothetical protein OXU61_12465 [Gammaproteobacteria bacterium]|nr:hypothetical protein [Gammaproteobacteria bacterium]
MRVPRSIYAGFPPLFKPGASSAREWRIFAVPVGSFSGSSGFSEFLHSLESRNPWRTRESRFSSPRLRSGLCGRRRQAGERVFGGDERAQSDLGSPASTREK